MTKSCLSSEVVEMLNEPLKNVFQPRVWALAVNRLDVVGDVIDSQIFKMGHSHF